MSIKDTCPVWTGTPRTLFAVNYANTILVNPPNPPGKVSNKDSMGGFGQLYGAGAPPFPPLDIPYLAASLTQAERPVEIIEAGAMHHSLDVFCAQLSANPLVGSSLVVVRTSLPTIDWDIDVCKAIKERCRPAAVLLYGPVVRPMLSLVKSRNVVDFAVLGEPDGAVLEMLAGTPTEDISGLVYKVNGTWVENPERKFEKNLDGMPFPRWDLMPIDRYIIPKSATAGTLRFLPMLSSRGCPFGCNYCPYPVGQGLPWRSRSGGNVVDELEHLVNDLKVEYVIFRDPLFSANKKRVQSMCEEIIRREIKIHWRCETRIDCLDEKTIEIMAKAGCVGVNFGVESSDPQVLKNVERKPITDEMHIETMAQFRKHGIATFAFFVIGLPGDTVDTILKTIRFALHLGASWTQFTVATPFIGTRLHDWAVEQGFVAADHYKINSAHEGSIGNENLTPAQVHRLHRFAQILQRNFINRRGVLKNDLRRDRPYVLAKGALDAIMRPIEYVLFTTGSALLRLSMPSTRRGAATVSERGKREPVVGALS